MTIEQKIIDFLKAQIGKPYKLGTRGPETFDCSGLTKRAAEIAGYTWYHGATTQWREGHLLGYWASTGTISSLPRNKLAFLFNQDKQGRMAHTGVYTGDGYVIQAGGYGGSGVHRNPIDTRRWSHWAILKGVEKEMAEGIMRGDIGEKVRRVQTLLVQAGYKLKPTRGDRIQGIDGKFGADTERAVREYQRDKGLATTGVWGEAEEKALKKADNESDTPQNEEMVSVPVRLLKELAAYLH